MAYVPTVRRIKSREEQVEAMQAAEQDTHLQQAFPTHIVRRPDGEIVGYWALNTVPTIWAWHKQDMKVRETDHVFATLDSIASELGMEHYVVPLCEGSPYQDYMKKLGFKEMGKATLYVKEI